MIDWSLMMVDIIKIYITICFLVETGLMDMLLDAWYGKPKKQEKK